MNEKGPKTPNLPVRDSYVEEVAEQILLASAEWKTAKDLALWLRINQNRFVLEDFARLKKVFEKIVQETDPKLIEGEWTKIRHVNAERAKVLLEEILSRPMFKKGQS